jgi:hypothetical protein
MITFCIVCCTVCVVAGIVWAVTDRWDSPQTLVNWAAGRVSLVSLCALIIGFAILCILGVNE